MRKSVVKIEVKDKSEGEQIKRALEDPAVRAAVVIAGALLPLTVRQRERVLYFVGESLNEVPAPPVLNLVPSAQEQPPDPVGA